jgi:hypothetical protein
MIGLRLLRVSRRLDFRKLSSLEGVGLFNVIRHGDTVS